MVNTKNILFKVEYAQALLKIAEGDLISAHSLMISSQPGRLENILYLIQQSVEKAIKSVLIKKQIAFPLVHDLGILIALLPVNDYPPGGFDLTSLNPFATVRRYEEGQIPISIDEVQFAYATTLKVIEWAKDLLN